MVPEDQMSRTIEERSGSKVVRYEADLGGHWMINTVEPNKSRSPHQNYVKGGSQGRRLGTRLNSLKQVINSIGHPSKPQ